MIIDNIAKVSQRIAAVCSKIKRDPNSITIVAISKGRTIEQIGEVIAAGITDIGENKVQEAMFKYEGRRMRDEGVRSEAEPPQRGRKIKWHMVGHLQTNKVKEAVKIFDLIQSVDSLRLAGEIEKQALKINKIQNILIEVNTSGELNKFGLRLDEAVGVIQEITKLKNISVKGLMTIAPVVDNPENARPYFRLLSELKEKINNLRLATYDLQLLSMGMTDDFEVAIEEGSNMVRLGRAIFEG